MSAPGFSLPPSAAFGAADTFVHSDVKCLLGTYRVLGVGETVATLTWFPPPGLVLVLSADHLDCISFGGDHKFLLLIMLGNRSSTS